MDDRITVCNFGTERSHQIDAFSQLPDDVLCKVTSFLDATTLCKVRRLNRKFKRLASKNSAGWEYLCRNLWMKKIHVCKHAQQQLQRPISTIGGINNADGDENAMLAYRISLLDGRNRDHVTREELIFDPDTGTGTIWSFRFKEAAGSDWTSLDPWYNNQPCRKAVFLEDGTVKTYIPTRTFQDQERRTDGVQHNANIGNDNMDIDGEEQGNGENGYHLVRPSFVAPQGNEILPGDDGNAGNVQDFSVPMTWRFVSQPLDFPDRPMGSYIRLCVGDREVPTYVCRRSPTDNWGFVLESCWGVYASFELPARPWNFVSQTLRRRRRQCRLRRSLNLVQGREIHFQVEIEDSSDDEEDEPTGQEALIFDDYFHVSTEMQWREAFLYNNFALAVLPEGSGAMENFRRSYGV